MRFLTPFFNQKIPPGPKMNKQKRFHKIICFNKDIKVCGPEVNNYVDTSSFEREKVMIKVI